MLLRPAPVFRHLIAQGNDDIAFFSMLFAGIMLTLLWADTFDLGRYYQTGQILSGILVLGPVVGILFCLLLAAMGFWVGNLLDRRHSQGPLMRRFMAATRPQEMRYGMLLACLSRAARVFIPMGLIMWMVSYTLEQTGFGGAEPASAGNGISWAVKLGFVLVFLYLWLQLLREGFALGWFRALVTGLASLGVAIFVVVFLVSFFTGLQLT